MANQRDAGSSQPSSLEERVAQLELQLAALQRQISADTPAQAQASIPREASVARTPAPPPPPVSVPVATAGLPLTSDSWAIPRPPVVSAPEIHDSFENRLGSQIFNRISIVLFMIGMAYFLKLAVDRQWIGPIGRVLIGLVAGAGTVLWSERFRKKGFAAFSYSLKALGSGVLYLSLWAAFQLFHLLPAGAALALMVLVTAWNAYMAWSQNSEMLAAYALAGGFVTPLLVSTGGNHEIFLFTYLLVIDLATVALVRLRPWPRLLLGAFPLTVAFFFGWYVEFYAIDELAVTSIFIALFAAAFASVPLRRITSGIASTEQRYGSLSILLEDVLLPLANAAFAALAFYNALQDAGHHELRPWLMIALAAVYLGIMRVPQTRAASAIHLSLAVVFLTVAIPLKASGHWITVSWLVEGLVLLWVATRLAPSGDAGEPETDPGSAHASRILRPLAAASLLLGFGGICFHSIDLVSMSDLPFLNKGTGTALTGIVVFAVAAWLSLRAGMLSRRDESKGASPNWVGIAVSLFILIDLTAGLLTMRELFLAWDGSGSHPAFQTSDFVAALIGLGVFAGVIAVSLRLARKHPDAAFWINCAVLTTIAFNLIAVLTGVREIDAIWSNSAMMTAEGTLQQALAISAFLMFYGAVLLAAGFWRRNSFLRWQGLVLLVFTIFKTFLYDMRNLSQGYRVASVLGLGALLMTISFAYQKDWLNLREPPKDDGSGTEQNEGTEATQ